MTDKGVGKLAEGCLRPSSLNLMGCFQVTDEGVGKLAEGCPQLSLLNLRNCTQVTDEGVGELVAGCPQLSSLDLMRCFQVTDKGVGKLASGCPQLSSLHLMGCFQVTDEGVGRLAVGCPQLSLLNLSGAGCPQLSWINLEGCPHVTQPVSMVGAILDHQKKNGRMEFLIAWKSYRGVSRVQTWEPAEHLRNTQKFEKYIRERDLSGAEHQAACPLLSWLSLRGCSVTNEVI